MRVRVVVTVGIGVMVRVWNRVTVRDVLELVFWLVLGFALHAHSKQHALLAHRRLHAMFAHNALHAQSTIHALLHCSAVPVHSALTT